MRRVVVMAVLVLLLAAAAVYDRSDRPGPSVAVSVAGADGPRAASPSALSSSWYCPGGPGVSGGALQTRVYVLNPGTEPMKGTATVFPSEGAPVSVNLSIGPATSKMLVLGVLAPGPWASALIDLDGGGAVVEQLVSGAPGADTMPCSATASTHWYFASGSTAKDATQSLVLFNPFPDDAIVDLAFATGEGRRVPGDFQGLVVRARTTRVVDIGAHVRRQDVVSTAASARAGRVIAGQLLVRTAPGVLGVSSTLGAPALGERWYFPDGMVSPTVNERFELFNPGTREAQVDIALALERDEAEPFELTVPAQGRVTLVVNSESRVPKGVPHAALAESVNGVPVVVQRVVESGAPRVGRADTLGARHPARRWALAFGDASDATDEWIVVQNPSARSATVSLTALLDGQRVPVEGLQGIVVPAGRRLAFRLGDHIKRAAPLALLVTATSDVVVERTLYSVGGVGVSMSMAVPL
jgi:hypothetical protein